MAEISEEMEVSEEIPDSMVAEAPNIDHIVTEDDTPVDNMFSEKQQRLLSGSLYDSWNPGRPFIAAILAIEYRPVRFQSP